MVVRKFKPGDRVQQKSGGPVMEVIHYEVEHKRLVGDFVSDQDVRCVWYGEEGRETGVFDQRTLTRSTKRHGLFTT